MLRNVKNYIRNYRKVSIGSQFFTDDVYRVEVGWVRKKSDLGKN